MKLQEEMKIQGQVWTAWPKNEEEQRQKMIEECGHDGCVKAAEEGWSETSTGVSRQT